MDDPKMLTKQLEASLAISEPHEDSLVLMPTMSIEVASERLREFQKFVRSYLNEGEDYGTIPGTPKPTLYKSGADKLCDIYGLSDSYNILAKTEEFDRGLFDYTVECVLTSRRTNQFMSSGLGCCSTWESKYRWRAATRKCPSCGKEAIIKGKAEFGGGWVCFKKKDGCGAKFADNDKALTSQEVGRTENPDIVDQKNTALKMAKKRAKIDAVLSATRSSGIFTQDMEDLGDRIDEADAFNRTPKEQEDFAAQTVAKMKAEQKAKPAMTKAADIIAKVGKIPESVQNADKEGNCPECEGQNGAHKWGCTNLKKPGVKKGNPADAQISRWENIDLQKARKESGIPDEDYRAVLANNGCPTMHGPDIKMGDFPAILKEIQNYRREPNDPR